MTVLGDDIIHVVHVYKCRTMYDIFFKFKTMIIKCSYIFVTL